MICVSDSIGTIVAIFFILQSGDRGRLRHISLSQIEGALAIWKLGILLEGSYARHLMGTTDDPFFVLLKEGVPAIGARALEVIRSG